MGQGQLCRIEESALGPFLGSGVDFHWVNKILKNLISSLQVVELKSMGQFVSNDYPPGPPIIMPRRFLQRL